MSMKVTRLQDLSTIMFELESLQDLPGMMRTSLSETAAFQKELDGTVYRILDLRAAMKEFNFSNMMLAMAEERGKPGGADDPNVVSLFIGSGDLVRIGTEALKQQEQYGNANVHLFESQEDALAFVREQVG